MGIVVGLPFVPPKRRPSRLRLSGRDMYYSSLSIYQLLPLRLRRSGRDITAALVSTNYLFFYLLSVLGGTGSILGGTGSILGGTVHY